LPKLADDHGGNVLRVDDRGMPGQVVGLDGRAIVLEADSVRDTVVVGIDILDAEDGAAVLREGVLAVLVGIRDLAVAIGVRDDVDALTKLGYEAVAAASGS